MHTPQITELIRRELTGLHGQARRKAYSVARDKAFISLGLRSDGKPRAQRRPCGCMSGSCLKCRRNTPKKIALDNQIAAMWADYNSGMSLTAAERKYGKTRGAIRDLFERRGLKVRPVKTVPKLGFGVKIPPATEQELESMISGLKRLGVPPALKREWRKWSLEKRHAFVLRLRVKFPSNRPTGPYSANVEPFEYGVPRVHAIAAKLNRGRNSRNKVIALKPCSEGVIWNGQIFFWDKNDTYVRGLGWRPETGRPLLKHLIWEATHGPVPDKTTVIQIDGNKNNFAPENLALRSMADCARMNGVPSRLKRDPRNPELQEKNKLRINRAVATRSETRTRKTRAQTSALVKQFQHQPGGELLAALQRKQS